MAGPGPNEKTRAADDNSNAMPKKLLWMRGCKDGPTWCLGLW